MPAAQSQGEDGYQPNIVIVNSGMLPIVATVLPEMLPLSSLAINDVTDVATFPSIYTFVISGKILALMYSEFYP
jgi:hypothetical protein